MTNQQMKSSFQDCSQPEEFFTHESHIRMGWIYVQSMPLTDAIASFCQDLRAYTVHLGASDKYHETITWFYLMLINERSAKLTKDHNWAEFKEANPDLFAPSSRVLQQFFSESLLSAELARTTVMLPDLIRS